jgi:hypothetical protein
MRTLLFVIIVYVGVDLISANIPTSTFESDLAEINKLSQDFKKSSPDVARQLTDATCQMISQCCPQIQSTFITMALSGNTQGLTDKCFGKKDSSNFLANILSCSPLMKITAMITNEKLKKYMLILTNKSIQDPEDIKLMLDTCSGEEMYSIACNWNRSDLQNTCERKVLQQYAQQGDQIYTEKVQKTKEGYIKLVNELKKEFNN